MTRDEAIKKVKDSGRGSDKLNRCTVYEKGFEFWYDDGIEDGPITIGGPHTPICIFRGTGHLVSEAGFMCSDPGEEIETIEI